MQEIEEAEYNVDYYKLSKFGIPDFNVGFLEDSHGLNVLSKVGTGTRATSATKSRQHFGKPAQEALESEDGFHLASGSKQDHFVPEEPSMYPKNLETVSPNLDEKVSREIEAGSPQFEEPSPNLKLSNGSFSPVDPSQS